MMLFADLSQGVCADRFAAALLDVSAALGGTDVATMQQRLSQMLPDLRASLVTVKGDTADARRLTVRRKAVLRPGGEAARPFHTTDSVKDILPSSGMDGHAARHLVSMVERLVAVGYGVDDVLLFTLATVSILMDELVVGKVHATPIALGAVASFADTPSNRADPRLMELAASAPLPMPLVAGPTSVPLATADGLAVVAEYVSSFEPFGAMAPVACGYGTGPRELKDASDVLRLVYARDLLAQPDVGAGLALEQVCLLETNIDHISAEAIATVVADVLRKGALDAWMTPVQMKKGRPGVLLSILAPTSKADALCRAVHHATGTLGIRRRLVVRSIAERETFEIDTPYGPVRFKVGFPKEVSEAYEDRWIRPEADDVMRIALATDRGYDVVRRELYTQATAWMQANSWTDRG